MRQGDFRPLHYWPKQKLPPLPFRIFQNKTRSRDNQKSLFLFLIWISAFFLGFCLIADQPVSIASLCLLKWLGLSTIWTFSAHSSWSQDHDLNFRATISGWRSCLFYGFLEKMLIWRCKPFWQIASACFPGWLSSRLLLSFLTQLYDRALTTQLFLTLFFMDSSLILREQPWIKMVNRKGTQWGREQNRKYRKR